MKLRAVILVLALVAVGPASGHEPRPRAMGVIEMATPTRIVVRLADGHTLAYVVTPETRFLDGTKPARLEEARAGRRVVVEGRPSADGMEAVRVRLGVAVAK